MFVFRVFSTPYFHRKELLCYPIPNLKKIYDYANAINKQNSPTCRGEAERRRKRNSGIPDAQSYIMCIAKSDNGCGCIGFFVPILLWPFKKRWTAADYRRVAEEQCIIYSRNGRAGVWKAFYNTHHGAMLEHANRIRGIKPLDWKDSRCILPTLSG